MLDTQNVVVEQPEAGFSAQNSTRRDAQTAHLLSQIAFLHREVERLEEQVVALRNKSCADARKITQQYEEVIAKKNADLEELRRRSSGQPDATDLSKRCKLLEKRLSTVNSEMNVIVAEKNELHTRLRKLEVLLKNRKEEVAAAQRSVEENEVERSSAITALKMAVEELSKENKGLKQQLVQKRKRLEVEREDKLTSTELSVFSTASQTDPIERTTQACQVNTAQAEKGPSLYVQQPAVYSLRTLLEEKTRECDDLRSRLDDLSAVQKDALAMLESTKRELADEVEQRRLAMSDAESLSLQIRGLQQRCSDQTAAERMLGERIGCLEDERQRLLVEKTRAERDRDTWEEQLRQYERDVSQLSATKNHSNQQLSALANENENLRVELQRFSEREAQMSYTLKAKDSEVQEILLAYQKAAHENESLLENQRFLERELDNARALVASKEESMIYVQEQLQSLHLREQQLTLDLQSFEYENETLHQRLARTDGESAGLERKCDELQQLLSAKDRSIEELHQSLRELSNQAMFSDNENLLLRQRCDELINDATRLRAQMAAERNRTQELEEANARLIAREVLSRGTHSISSYDIEQLEHERSEKLSVMKERDCMTEEYASLQKKHEELEKKLVSIEKALREASESKERLHRIVVEQNEALAHLSK
jgi:chromosome segregation ATPase